MADKLNRRGNGGLDRMCKKTKWDAGILSIMFILFKNPNPV
jgi:hypothetical protein